MLKVTNVHKSFGKNEILKGVDLTVEKGSRHQRKLLLLLYQRKRKFSGSLKITEYSLLHWVMPVRLLFRKQKRGSQKMRYLW